MEHQSRHEQGQGFSSAKVSQRRLTQRHPPFRSAGPVVDVSALAALQRMAGNQAVETLLQRSAAIVVQRNGGNSRERLTAYLAAVRGGNWNAAASSLRHFSDQSMHQRIRNLSHDQRVHLVRACLRGRPAWSARITTAVKTSDGEAERVGRLYADWDEAVTARTWGPAALALNAFNDIDLAALVAALPVGQLEELKQGARASMPGFADRVVNAVDQRISGAVIGAGAALVGHLRWRGGQGPDPAAGYQVRETTAWGHRDDFARWIRGTGPEPGPTSTMNCWEAVLFFAYRAGVVPKAFLVSMHQAATAAASAAQDTKVWYTALQARMHSGPLQTYTINPATGLGSPLIPAGNIVFLNGLQHVVLSRGTRDGTGRMRVLSLWVIPAYLPPGPLNEMTSYGVVQETSVEEVAAAGTVIQFGRPPW